MAKALEYPAIFKVLLNGGYICKSVPVTRKAEYELYLHGDYVGHITQNQFEQLVHQDVIESDPQCYLVDKHRTVSTLFYLRQKKDGDEK